MFERASTSSDGLAKVFPRRATVTPYIKFLVTPQSESHPESKILKFVFMFAQYVLGLDFGFLSGEPISPKQRLCLKYYTLLLPIVLGSYVCSTVLFRGGIIFWVILDLLVFYLFVIVTTSCKYTYSDFISDMRAIDREIKVDSSTYKLEYKMVACLSAVLTFTTIHMTLVSIHASEDSNLNSILLAISFVIMLGSADFVRITYVFVFAFAYWRISKFTKFVKDDCADIITCQYLYKHITDITEKAKANYNLVFVVTLIFHSAVVAKIMFIPFLNTSIRQKLMALLITETIVVFKGIFIMFAPTFTAGLLTAEVEKLVLVLRDKLLVAKEEKTQRDMRRFITYIEARPMRFTVCEVIPLDWNFPITVIRLAITYLIVMIQFTFK